MAAEMVAIGALRLKTRGIRKINEHVRIVVDGKQVDALKGETIAAALVAADLVRLGCYPNGDPRGLSCGMGACQTCVVTVNGCDRSRACMTMVADGMRVSTNCRTALQHSTPILDSDGVAAISSSVDVVVIGAGPAGMTAALELVGAGLCVVILDERDAPGGQYFKPLAKSHVFSDGTSTDVQFERGAQLRQKLFASSVKIRQGATVWDVRVEAEGDYSIAYDHRGRSHRLRVRHVIVATGAIERPWPVPGWTLPGAMTTGAAQTLARSYRVAPGSRILIAGNGPLNLQVSAELLAGGANVVAIAEAAKHPIMAPAALARMALFRPDLMLDGLRYSARIAKSRRKVFWQHALVRVDGQKRVQAAVLAKLDDGGLPVPGSEFRIPVDCVTMGYGFQPADEILRLFGCKIGPDSTVECNLNGRTSIPGIYAIGDCRGIFGAAAAMADARLAALDIIAQLTGDSVALSGRALKRQQTERRFQKALWTVFAAKLPPFLALNEEETVLCRCESVRRANVEGALAIGSIEAIKRQTRCGMGLCQGRYCLPVIARMVRETNNEATGTDMPKIQTPLKPVEAASVVSLLDECTLPVGPPATLVLRGPHRDVSPAAERHCAVLVVGGGIVGICAALELAKAGEDVVLAEAREATGLEASGANAGSLHVQSLAYSFQTFETPAAQLALRMLPLQRESVGLWEKHARDIGADLEIHVGGGLCIADDEAGLLKLRNKVALERAAGIEVELLEGNAARRMLPSLSSSVLGASFSPDEGKLNPLKAMPAMAAAALRAGACIVSNAPVSDVRRDRDGFLVATPAGMIHAKRIILTAGSGSALIAQSLGVKLAIARTPLQMIVTERLPSEFGLLLTHVSQRLTVKQAKSGNLIIGGGWRVPNGPDGNPRTDVNNIAANLRLAAAALNELGRLKVLRSWVAVNSLPTAGPLVGALPGVPGCYLAVALNGLTLGPILGKVCADLARGRKSEFDISAFDPARPGATG